MRLDVVTLFPGMFNGPLTESILGRAQRDGIVEIGFVDLRAFAQDRRRTVDDTPYGGGAGMVLKPEPLVAALASVRRPDSRVILMTPQGVRFTQADAQRLARLPHLVFVCGQYEGVDERVRQSLVDEEISIGDFVLTNGNLAAMVVADAVIRLLPGALGSDESAESESFSAEGLLEYPQYTRPETHAGMTVPAVLREGHHGRIAAWRWGQRVVRTVARRPELLLATLKETNHA
jgi:tRNA (guanine37-N1)-methyltransferase